MALTTATAASAPFAYVMATFAPSAARRLAIAAPMPREPPVMSATLPASGLSRVVFIGTSCVSRVECTVKSPRRARHQCLSYCEDDSAEGTLLYEVTQRISRLGQREGLGHD